MPNRQWLDEAALSRFQTSWPRDSLLHQAPRHLKCNLCSWNRPRDGYVSMFEGWNVETSVHQRLHRMGKNPRPIHKTVRCKDVQSHSCSGIVCTHGCQSIATKATNATKRWKGDKPLKTDWPRLNRFHLGSIDIWSICPRKLRCRSTQHLNWQHADIFCYGGHATWSKCVPDKWACSGRRPDVVKFCQIKFSCLVSENISGTFRNRDFLKFRCAILGYSETAAWSSNACSDNQVWKLWCGIALNGTSWLLPAFTVSLLAGSNTSPCPSSWALAVTCSLTYAQREGNTKRQMSKRSSEQPNSKFATWVLLCQLWCSCYHSFDAKN